MDRFTERLAPRSLDPPEDELVFRHVRKSRRLFDQPVVDLIDQRVIDLPLVAFPDEPVAKFGLEFIQHERGRGDIAALEPNVRDRPFGPPEVRFEPALVDDHSDEAPAVETRHFFFRQLLSDHQDLEFLDRRALPDLPCGGVLGVAEHALVVLNGWMRQHVDDHLSVTRHHGLVKRRVHLVDLVAVHLVATGHDRREENAYPDSDSSCLHHHVPKRLSENARECDPKHRVFTSIRASRMSITRGSEMPRNRGCAAGSAPTMGRAAPFAPVFDGGFKK